MANVLIFSHVPTWSAHHAEAVELALQEQEGGNNVYFLSCVGGLLTCPANSYRREILCKLCRHQTHHTNTRILRGRVNTLTLRLDEISWQDNYFESVDTLKKFQLDGVPFGAMVYSTITSILNDSFFDTLRHSSWINALLRNALALFRASENIILKKNIDKVYVWNGRRSCDGPVVYAAKHLNKDYNTFISGGQFNSILVRARSENVQDVSAAKRDLGYIVQMTKDPTKIFSITSSAVDYYKYASGQDKQGRVNHLGYYQFSQLFEKGSDSNLARLKDGRRIIAVFVGTYSEFAGVNGYDSEGNFCRNFYDGVSFLQEQIHLVEKSLLVVRWHPNSRTLTGVERQRLETIVRRGREIDNVYHIPPDSNFNTYDLIKGCDLAVAFGTSVAVEACLYGKPVIFVGNNKFEDLECFYRPSSWDGLINLLDQELEVGSFEHALAWGHFYSTTGNIYFKHLKQIRPNVFYMRNIPLTSWPLRIRSALGRIRRRYGRF